MTHFKIRKNSLQETLIIPLYARWLCSQKFPGLFQDKTAGELIKKVDYDFSSLEKRSESIMYSWSGRYFTGTERFQNYRSICQ